MTEQEQAVAIALALSVAKNALCAAVDLAARGVTPARRERLLRLAAQAEWMRRSFLIGLNPAELELVYVGGPLDGQAAHLELPADRLSQSHGERLVVPRTAAVAGEKLFTTQLGDSPADGYAYRLDLKTCRLHFIGLQEALEVPNAHD